MLGVVPITEPVYFPRGAADPAGRTGYLALDSGILAVDLGAGQALWRSEHAQRPLLVAGERLAAARLRQDPCVVLLEPGGEPVLTSEPVAMSSEARLRARIDKDRLVVEWEGGGGYAGGAPPPPEIRERAAAGAVGAAAIDLASGAVEPLPPPPQDGVRRPPVDDLEGPWLAGDTVVELVWDEQALRLRTPRGTVELARGDTLAAEPTPDGRHLLVREGDRWVCVSAETGERKATVGYEPGAREPAIVGRRLYHLVDRGGTRALKARDLDTDTVAWELVVGERRPSGPPRLRQ